MSFRVLSAEIAHETNTFNIRPTTMQCFQDRFLLAGDQAIAARGDKNTELAGLLDVGRDYGWQIDHTISAAAGPGGKVTRQAFDFVDSSFNPCGGTRMGWHFFDASRRDGHKLQRRWRR